MPQNTPPTLNILFLASEADPFVKIGGLGDVAGSLPGALLALSAAKLDVRLAIPFHNAIHIENFPMQRELAFSLPRQGVDVPVEVFRTDLNGLPVYLISGDPIRRSDKVYDLDPRVDSEKYVFFSLAALELARRLDWRPDVVHANDWHTAAALYAVRRRQDDPFWARTKTVMCVHNLCYMGAGSEDALTAYGLPPVDEPALPDWARQVPLPLALWAADKIVAVSPTYAEEIQTPEYGCGLEGFLRSRHESITGIINGIDNTLWDPATDTFLPVNFTPKKLSARGTIKSALQSQFGLDIDPAVPLLGMVTRMDQQKGVDIAVDALRQLPDEPWQALLLGTGNAELEIAARHLEMDFPQRVTAVLRYDGKLAHQIYGGSDMLLMPSRYEPCGLAQMIAMRYGSIPVARATGGLRDTIADGRTGFLFTEPSGSVMVATLRRALAAFRDHAAWQAIQKAAMAENFSWEQSARQYAALYRSCILV
jgi:starch synthase